MQRASKVSVTFEGDFRADVVFMDPILLSPLLSE